MAWLFAANTKSKSSCTHPPTPTNNSRTDTQLRLIIIFYCARAAIILPRWWKLNKQSLPLWRPHIRSRVHSHRQSVSRPLQANQREALPSLTFRLRLAGAKLKKLASLCSLPLALCYSRCPRRCSGKHVPTPIARFHYFSPQTRPAHNLSTRRRAAPRQVSKSLHFKWAEPYCGNFYLQMMFCNW